MICSVRHPKEFPMIIGKIEKEVAIPEAHSRIRYPWPERKAGNSVLMEAEKGKKPYNLKRKIGPSARYYREKGGYYETS
jgi:hypothetical protein